MKMKTPRTIGSWKDAAARARHRRGAEREGDVQHPGGATVELMHLNSNSCAGLEWHHHGAEEGRAYLLPRRPFPGTASMASLWTVITMRSVPASTV